MIETRVLLLSNRDSQEDIDEPPLQQRIGGGLMRPSNEDGVAEAAENTFQALSQVPGVRALHRCVFRPNELYAAAREHRPDVIFNLCEALAGDSRLEVMAAWVLQRLGLPFTGSPYWALRHCLYKDEAARILSRAGVRVPATARVHSPNHIPAIRFPVIVKPEREDGSLGIERGSVVHDERGLRAQVARVVETYKQAAIVQSYIHGRELAVALVGWPSPRVLPIGEITFHDLPADYPHIVTYEAKWRPETAAYTSTASVAAVLRPLELRRVAAIGRLAFDALGLRDYGRVDVRLDPTGVPYVIDVNPNCDMTSGGGLAKAAARAGMSYEQLIWEILQCALRRGPDVAFLSGSRGRAPRALPSNGGRDLSRPGAFTSAGDPLLHGELS